MKKKPEILTPQELRIKTDKHVDVTERVKDGRTRFFHDYPTAKKHADQKRSYVYPAFDAKQNHIGHCVPN